jgi:hypothetical protein
VRIGTAILVGVGLFLVLGGLAVWKRLANDVPVHAEGTDNAPTGGATRKPNVGPAVERCIDLWNAKEIEGIDREVFADRLLETTVARGEGGVTVSRDPSGTCVVAFPRIVGNRPGNLIWLYGRSRWHRYLSISREEASVDPTGANARRDRVSPHITVLEYRARESPNARLLEGGYLTVPGSHTQPLNSGGG